MDNNGANISTFPGVFCHPKWWAAIIFPIRCIRNENKNITLCKNNGQTSELEMIIDPRTIEAQGGY
jgi:hypothetical protein